jgi:hypothetical protein
MASRLARALAVVLLALAGACGLGQEPVVIELDGDGLNVVIISDVDAASAADERWELVELPAASRGGVLRAGNSAVILQPDVRGFYVVERWLALGVSRTLTHRFIVAVAGRAGQPSIEAPDRSSVGAVITVNGEASTSPEGLPLSYQWRLAERPRDSEASIENDVAAQASFTADVAGQFVIALAVFDGQLWSEEATATIAVAP